MLSERHDRHLREDTRPRLGDKLVARNFAWWPAVALARLLRRIVHRVVYGLLGTVAGRFVLFAAGMWLLANEAFSSGQWSDYLGAWTFWLVVAAGVYGAWSYRQRRIWEDRVRNVIYHNVPGHSVREPEVLWFWTRANLARWIGGWGFGFRVPAAVEGLKLEEIEYQLRERLPAAEGTSWAVDWDLRSSVAFAKPSPDIPKKVARAEKVDDSEGESTEIPLGEALGGKRIVWELANNFGCLLVCGAPGGGKSVILRTILAHCLARRAEWRTYLIDPKVVEFGNLSKYPGVEAVATDLEVASGVLEDLREKMKVRYKMLDEAGVQKVAELNGVRAARGEAPLPRVMVIIDEIAELVEESERKDPEGKEEDQVRRKCKGHIDSLVRLGRAAGLHCALATQRPDATFISGATKSNIQARVAAGGLSSTGSEMAIESDLAARLPGIPGRAIYYESGRLEEMQGYWTSVEDLDVLTTANGNG